MAPEDDSAGDGDANPEVHDPAAEVHDPEESLDTPAVEGPTIPEVSPPTPGSSDAPKELRSSFWILVLVANAVVLALAVGAMFVVFRGNWDLGGRLFLVGGVLGVYGYYRYRNFPDASDLEDDADGTGDGSRDGDDADRTDGRSTDDEPGGETTAADDPGGDTTATDDPGDWDPTDEPATAPAGTVRDADGNRYLLVKRSGESSLVRDPTTGTQRYLPNETLEPVDRSPLEAAAEGVPAATRRVLSATHDDRSLGLLVELVDRGPVAVRTLLGDYDLCESDLHGLLGEFRAAGLVEETTVAGERGYETTDLADRGVENLRTTGRA